MECAEAGLYLMHLQIRAEAGYIHLGVSSPNHAPSTLQVKKSFAASFDMPSLSIRVSITRSKVKSSAFLRCLSR